MIGKYKNCVGFRFVFFFFTGTIFINHAGEGLVAKAVGLTSNAIHSHKD